MYRGRVLSPVTIHLLCIVRIGAVSKRVIGRRCLCGSRKGTLDKNGALGHVRELVPARRRGAEAKESSSVEHGGEWLDGALPGVVVPNGGRGDGQQRARLFVKSSTLRPRPCPLPAGLPTILPTRPASPDLGSL